MAESGARLQILINRAQRLITEATVAENQDDDDFLSGFQHFRRSHDSRLRAGSSRKKKKHVYSIKVTCLDSPEYKTTIVKTMNEKQLGYRSIKIERSAPIEKLTDKVMSVFKFSCSFKYMKAVRNENNICELKEMQVTTTKDVKSKIGRSNLYILPAEKIGQSSLVESSDDSGSSLPNPHLDAIPQRRSRLGRRTNDLTDEDILPSINVPVRQRLDSSTVGAAPNAVNNPDPTQVSQNNSAGRRRSTLSTTRRRSTLSTPRRRSTATSSGTQEQENNVEIMQPSIIDVTEETPQEVVAAGYRTATGDSPTVLFRTSAPLRIDHLETSSLLIPNQTARSQQFIDITRELHVNDTNDNALNDYIPEIAPFGDVGQNPSADGLKDVLVEHRELFIKSTSEEDPLLMEVRRGYVLVDSIAIIRFSGDDLHSPLSIKFMDEEGVDLGGLRREFWSLMLHNISHSCYVTGKPGRQTFQANYLEKKRKHFFTLDS